MGNKSLDGKVIVITGASSGIGEATARLLAEHGAYVVMGARRVDRLEAVASEIRSQGGSVEYRQLDVTKLGEVEAILQGAHKQFGKVDALVNNAGIMPLSPLEALKIEEWDRMIDVNIRGVLHGTAAAIPIMKEQGYGHIINVASVGAYSVTRTAAVYCATKYAVRALTEGVRIELGDTIRTTLVSPGVTESELASTITDESTKAFMGEYRRNAIPASSIARAIAYAIEQPAEVDVNELIVRPAAKRA